MIKKKIIFTAGSWDLFHSGHLNILLKAKTLGDYLIVGVSTNKLIKQYKGLKPVFSYRDRVTIVKELKCVNKVVKQTKIFDVKQFKKLKADVFIVGSDWKYGYGNEGLQWLREHGKIVFIPYTKRLSTTIIKERIIKNSYNIIMNQIKRKAKGK